jgi:hypothetical protein
LLLELRMPCFFFDITDANTPIACEGAELASVHAARCHALQYAGRILCDQDPSFWSDDDWVMTVSDENHLTLFTISVSTVDAPSTARLSRPAHASPAS